MSGNARRFTVNLPEDLYLSLHNMAGQRNVTKKDLVVEAIRYYLELTPAHGYVPKRKS